MMIATRVIKEDLLCKEPKLEQRQKRMRDRERRENKKTRERNKKNSTFKHI